MKRVCRFLKSLWKYLLYGKRVAFNNFVVRLEFCNWCEDMDKENWKCNACGCYVHKKAKMSTERCPKNKWVD